MKNKVFSLHFKFYKVKFLASPTTDDDKNDGKINAVYHFSPSSSFREWAWFANANHGLVCNTPLW